MDPGFNRKRFLEQDRRRDEEFMLEIFLKAYGKTHGRPVRGTPGADPDFLVDIEGHGEVAVELTETVLPFRREREELAHEIVRQASDAYGRTGGPPLNVWFQFHDARLPARQGVAERILGVVRSLEPASLPLHDMRYVEENQLQEAGLGFLASLGVLRMMDGRNSRWMITDAGTVRELTPADLQDIIGRKDGARAGFQEHPGRPAWLVIYTKDDRVSGSADPSPTAAAGSFGAGFQRVFLLDAPRAILHELHVEPRPLT